MYFEEDEAFYLDIQRSRSRALLLLTASSHSTSEVRFASADRPTDPFGVVVPRQSGIEYGVSHHGDRFFITTNDEASNFRLVSAPVSDPSKASWSEVLPHRPAIKVDGTDAFRDHLVVYEREAGLRQVRIITLATGEEHLISFPEPVYSIRTHENPEFDTTVLRFTYTSMVTPSSVVEYDMAARSWTVRKQTEVLGGYDQTPLSERAPLCDRARRNPRSRSRWSTGSRSSGTDVARSGSMAMAPMESASTRDSRRTA